MYDPHFEITTRILESIGQIEGARGVIDNAPLLPLYERQFKSEATVRKVHFSTAIEGNYLNLDEVRKIVSAPNSDIERITDSYGDEVIARKRDLHEVINYRDVVKLIESVVDAYRKEKKFELSTELIKQLHSVLLKNIRDDILGQFRTQNVLTVNYATGEKLYPYEEVGNYAVKLRELIEWYNSDNSNQLHPVLKAGLLHLEFVRIHPFEEGNGRLARVLATLSLSIDGYDVGHFFCLDEYYDSDAQEYYNHLAQGFTNPTEWLEYFSLGMAIEFNRIKERVQKISKDAKIKEKTGQVFITERQEQIIQWINDYGYIQNKDFDVLFPDVSDDTVLRELKGLIDNDIIVKKGKTKSARYEIVST